jgi:sigma-B regulation protein RsbU (phosphoserine phosphatase)
LAAPAACSGTAFHRKVAPVIIEVSVYEPQRPRSRRAARVASKHVSSGSLDGRFDALLEFLEALRSRAETGVRGSTLAQALGEASSMVTDLRGLAQAVCRENEKLASAAADTTRELRRAEVAERLSGERYRQIVELASEGIWIIDADDRTSFVNQRMADLLGYSIEEMVGERLFSFVDEEWRKAAERNVERRRLGIGEQHDFQFRRKDGRPLVAALSTTAIVDEQGQYQGALALVTDVTDRRQLEAERGEALRLSEALSGMNLTLGTIHDPDQLMNRVITEAAQALGAEAALVNLRQNGHWVVAYSYGYPEGLRGRTFQDDEFTLSSLVMGLESPIGVPDALADERCNRDVMCQLGMQSLLAAPLFSHGRPVGTFVFSFQSRPVATIETQTGFAARLAASVSLALENAQAYESQRIIAQSLQEALLTVPPRLPGVKFGHLHRSATIGADVGGDFYDLFLMDRGHIGVLIGDVAGRGIGAAALASLAKNAMKAFAYEHGTPATVMARTNEVLWRQSNGANFITAFFGRLNPGTGRLQYARAGHPPPVVRRNTGETVFLEVGSPPLAAWNRAAYTAAQTRLKSGDLLFLYTDGATEARRGPEFFGERRLVDVLGKVATRPVNEVPAEVLRHVIEFAGGPLPDDLALLALGVEGGRIGAGKRRV